MASPPPATSSPVLAENDEAPAVNDPSSQDPPSSSSKRKRKRSKSKGGPGPVKQGLLLQGYVVAVSTLDVRDCPHADPALSFKKLNASLLREGATLSSQVNKRITLLLCTPRAVENQTQKVRKAIRFGIPMVHVDWLKQCQEKRIVAHVDEHTIASSSSLVDSGHEKTKQKPRTTEEEGHKVTVVVEDTKAQATTTIVAGNLTIDEMGWSDEKELGCCCVCHENNDPACPYCQQDCSQSSPRVDLMSDSRTDLSKQRHACLRLS